MVFTLWTHATESSLQCTCNDFASEDARTLRAPLRARIQTLQAQKLCVHAVNSMRRDDVGEAVEALRSALKLLTGGGAGAAACAR